MNTASVIEILLFGAIAMAIVSAVVAVVGYFSWKLWHLLNSIDSSVKDLSKDLKEFSENIDEAKKIIGGVLAELAYMRSMTQQVPQTLDQPDMNTMAGMALEKQRVPIPFPSPIFDRYPVVPEPPDATKEDTDMDLLRQTDEDLVDMEALEKLREMGIEVEDSNTVHKGVEAEAD